MVILIDTNVILDFLDQRPQYSDAAEEVFRLCSTRKISAFVAAHSICNIFYILQKKYSSQDRKSLLINLLGLVDVSGIDKSMVIETLHDLNFDDIEDSLQEKCAIIETADYIVTRNTKDFKQSKIPAVEPENFLKLFKNGDEEG